MMWSITVKRIIKVELACTIVSPSRYYSVCSDSRYLDNDIKVRVGTSRKPQGKLSQWNDFLFS